MDYRKTVSKIKSLKEAAPTNNTSGVENFDKFLFPGDTDLLTQDWQTPYQLKWGLSDVVPVKHLTLADIDTMTSASTEYVNKMNEETPKRTLTSPLENVRDIVRGLNEGAAWTKKAGKNKEGGLNEKGRKSYERENPGSDLKAPQPEGGSRKKSFCARMGGMKKKLTSSKTANDPDSRINKALRKWKCNEEMMGGAPTNNVGGGNIAGAVPGETPPVFKKKSKPTPVGRYGSRRMWIQDLKKNGK